MKPGLEKTFQLADGAGNPQKGLRFIHVAGTNGKGSTCAMLESIYRAAGYKTGLFTSPHLISFRERIQVNRELISEAEVARLVAEFGRDASLTFFEAVTIMALKYFAGQRCEVVIWETGLGGRLDATNIVTPLVSVITNVQLDHEQWLGKTIEEIAFEKAGIIKPGIPVVTAAEEPALGVIKKVALERGAPVTLARPLAGFEIELTGAHQRVNAGLAVAAVEAARGRLPVTDEAMGKGLKEARWAGRLQRVERGGGQVFLLDGAHNPAGARALAEVLSKEYKSGKPAMILGAMADKDCAGICGLLAPVASRLFLTPVSSGRSADPHLLAEYCRAVDPAARIEVCQDLPDALARAEGERFVVVTGSLHFIGEALERLGLAETASERELNEYTTPKSDIRGVTFDVGGTLIEPWPSVGHVYARVVARHGLNLSPEALNRNFAMAWKRRKDFGHSMLDWAGMVDETFAGLIEGPVSEALFTELFDEFKRADAWRVFEDTVPTLQALRLRGIKLGAISNWDERLRPLLRAMDLERYFDTILVSVEESCPKPGAAIFKAAAERLGIPPAKIAHIGDSLAEDYEGAVAAGFQAILLNRRGLADPSATEVSRLDDALKLLQLAG